MFEWGKSVLEIFLYGRNPHPKKQHQKLFAKGKKSVCVGVPTKAAAAISTAKKYIFFLFWGGSVVR
jgi:hypothetical protein